MSRQFGVNSLRAMHETIEGEVIVIDLTSGSYYSLRDVSAEIWHELQRTDEVGIVAALERRYEGQHEEILAGVMRLLDELAAEGLIESIDASGGESAAPTVPSSITNGRTPFRAPVLEKHSDMQDLILLDPVHEVGPQGWPHAANSEGL
jgi:hypothetical protein